MKTLIGMREFVLLEFSKRNVYYYQDSKVLNKINNYANFLSRQPKLSDFVPCGEDGFPLDEPKDYQRFLSVDFELTTNQESLKECIAYQQALDKVLFKGFEVFTDNEDFTRIELKDKLFITFYKEAETIVLNAPYAGIKGITNLESLTPYNLELTENANKIIGV